MILIALGANLPSQDYGAPVNTLEAVLDSFPDHGLRVIARSDWYGSAAVPASDQPDYVNGVVLVEGTFTADALLAKLHAIERAVGRIRAHRNEARVLDLDLLDFKGEVTDAADGLVLPHPRMHLRPFVLVPLRDIAPQWKHPLSGKTASELLAELPASLGAPGLIWRLDDTG